MVSLISLTRCRKCEVGLGLHHYYLLLPTTPPPNTRYPLPTTLHPLPTTKVVLSLGGTAAVLDLLRVVHPGKAAADGVQPDTHPSPSPNPNPNPTPNPTPHQACSWTGPPKARAGYGA